MRASSQVDGSITCDPDNVGASKANGDGKLAITGDLTIKGITSKGITRPVVLDADLNRIAGNPMTGQPAAGFDATATIERIDFGLGMLVPNVSDEVQLRITNEASVPKRSGERRVGKECGRTCRSRGWTYR